MPGDELPSSCPYGSPDLIVSSVWQRHIADPLATGQRWYCRICGARYRTANGCLLQISEGGRDYWIRTECPDELPKKLKAVAVQRDHPEAVTPSALVEAIPQAAIVDSAFIKEIKLPDNPLGGVYSYDGAVFDTLPLFPWSTLFAANVGGAAMGTS